MSLQNLENEDGQGRQRGNCEAGWIRVNEFPEAYRMNGFFRACELRLSS